MKMNKKKYIRPALRVIEFRESLMQTLPVGNSRERTDSGDDDGGGLSRRRYETDPEEDNNFWGDDWEQH